MSLAPLPAPRVPRERLFSTPSSPRRRAFPQTAALSRHHWRVRILKYLLPIIGLGLLGSIALWPEVARLEDQERITLRRLATPDVETGEVLDPHYRGVDERAEPYTVTAAQARQAGEDRINLLSPQGDLVTGSNSWVMIRSLHGVYMQHASLLDLSEDVVLYRDDGTTLYTENATMDLNAGAAVGAEKVHSEGPFGTLDAQGFALTDKGDVVQFTGPAHMVVNSVASPAAAPATP